MYDEFYRVYILDTFITMLSYWLLFLIFRTNALPSGLVFAINDHAFLITPRCRPKEL